MESNVTFGEFLKFKRQEKKLTLDVFAKMSDYTYSYWAKVERGDKKPPAEYRLLTTVAQKLGLSESDTELLYDLAAKEQDIVPPDVSEYVHGNESLIEFLRTARMLEISDKDWFDLALTLKIYCGTNPDRNSCTDLEQKGE